MEIDHVGIATNRADELAELYTAVFEMPIVHEERSEETGLRFVFLDGGNGFFELLEPLENETLIGRYLDDHGAGIHHVALRTTSIEAALETAREHGIELIDESPRPGAWNHDIAFLHPRSTGGALIEFVQHT